MTLEAEIGGRLPKGYREYLLRMGRDPTMWGQRCQARHVLENNEILVELLQDGDLQAALPARHVCFFTHDGYQAAWFDLDSVDDDPIAWWFSDSDEEPTNVGPFTEFMRTLTGECGGKWRAS